MKENEEKSQKCNIFFTIEIRTHPLGVFLFYQKEF